MNRCNAVFRITESIAKEQYNRKVKYKILFWIIAFSKKSLSFTLHLNKTKPSCQFLFGGYNNEI